MVKINVTDIANAWISFYSLKGTDKAANFEWAQIEVDYLTTDNPKKCWEVILEILRLTENEYCLGSLAAGPFESLMFAHSDSMLDLVRAKAKEDTKFNKVFSDANELQETISDEEWNNIFREI